MKQFNIKSLFFIIPIIILGVLFEFLLRVIPNDYTYKRAYLEQNKNQIETLIFGSSHAYYGLNPVYFDSKTFNVAYVSQTLDFDAKIFDKYKEQMPHLKSIIMTISYFSFFEDLYIGGEPWRIKNYAKYCDLGSSGIFEKTEILGQKFSTNMTRFFKFYIKKDSLITTSSLGWGVYDKNNNLEVSGKEAAMRHTYYNINQEITNNFVNILDSIITYCEARKINVIILTLPAYQSYRDNLNAYQLEKTIEITNNLVKKHKNCIYFNLLEDNSLSTNDFRDGDHLNESGSKKISLKINRIIEEMNEK